MSCVRIWVHIIFSVKNRELQTLTEAGKKSLITHIKEQCRTKDIYLDRINGYFDHLHILISLGKKQTIADVVQSIKGESSFWANKQVLFPHKLQWQDDYFAVSVSESQAPKVRRYIDNQEEHHTKKTFAEEIEEFMQKHGWDYIKD
jgi:putative transposase